MTGPNIRQYGNVDLSDYIEPGNLVESYIEYKRDQDKTEQTIRNLELHLLENRRETAFKQFLSQRGIDSINEVSAKDARKYIEYLEDKGQSKRDIRNKLVEASTVFNFMMSLGYVDANPVGLVLKESDFNEVESPDRIHISISEMAEYIRSINEPMFRSIALYLVKYGFRRAVTVNTDLQCLNLEFPEYYNLLDELGITLRKEVRNRPDSIYIYADYSEGDVVAGEERSEGSRRSNEAIVPIDPEFKRSLIDWLSIRPKTDGPPHPLYTNRAPRDGRVYERLRGAEVYEKLVDKHGKEQGLVRDERCRNDLDTHYFRHFFRTQMKRNWGDHGKWIPEGLITYIRGDKGEQPLETYQQDHWGVEVREPYLDAIYDFKIYPE